MKSYFLLLTFLATILHNTTAQQNESAGKTEKKVIIKKFSHTGDKQLTDEEIQKLIDSVMQHDKINIQSTDGDQVIIIKKSEDGKEKTINITSGNKHKTVTLNPDAEDSNDDRTITINMDDNNSIEESNEHTAEITPPNKAVMGVTIKDVGGNNGALIESIYANSAAEKAGLEEGDIIIKLDGNKIGVMMDVINILSDKSVGDKVTVKYLRNGKTQSKKIVLQAAPQIAKQSCCKAGNACCKNKNLSKNSNRNENKYIVIKKDKAETEDNKATEIEKTIRIESVENNANTESHNLSISYLSSYPNPNQGQMTIDYTSKKGPLTIQVLDLNGKELYNETIHDFSGSLHKQINIEESKGAIILKMIQDGEVNSQKIIIE